MAKYKELAEKYGDRLRQEYAGAKYRPGRRTISRMLEEWTGTHISEYAARMVMQEVGLPKGVSAGRALNLTRVDDNSPNPLEREISAKGVSIKTLGELLAAAEVDC